MQGTDSLQKTLMLGKIEGRRRGRQRMRWLEHYWFNGHESEQAPGAGDGQGGLGCCSPWGHRASDTTATELNWFPVPLCCAVLSHSVVSDSLWPRGLSPTRLLCPLNSPGKNTGVGCHIFSRGSSPPKDQTRISCIAGRFFTCWVTEEALCSQYYVCLKWRLPWGLSGRESSRQCRRNTSYLRVEKIPWRRKWQPTLVVLPGKSHGKEALLAIVHRVTRVGSDLATKQQQ